MKNIKSYKLFLEDLNNPNTPQGYLSTLSKKPQQKLNQKNQQQKPTDEVDTILQNTEDQKQQIILKKDTIEKGLLNNIRNLEPENQKDVQTQVRDYGVQVKEFDKTVKQIGNLKKTLDKSNIGQPKFKPQIQKARTQNKL